ncbi:MAG: hypothetical protein ILA02_00145 [Clostridia bacterium]|nr:hypothetical protein [Clostridia bacterium]
MFDKKIKIKLTPEEYKLVRDVVMEIRNDQVKRGETPSPVVVSLLAKLMS